MFVMYMPIFFHTIQQSMETTWERDGCAGRNERTVAQRPKKSERGEGDDEGERWGEG